MAEIKEKSGDWRFVVETQLVPSGRGGWIGVWDALKAAFTRRERYTVLVPYTLSMWVKPGDLKTEAYLVQLEQGPPTPFEPIHE